jgi:uncharacterized protein YjiS (DUF1127 family)
MAKSLTLRTGVPQGGHGLVYRVAHAPSPLALLGAWYRRWTQMQSLTSLDDRMLRDIGLDRVVVNAATGKSLLSR